MKETLFAWVMDGSAREQIEEKRAHFFPGSAPASRAGLGALAIANFSIRPKISHKFERAFDLPGPIILGGISLHP